jgi:hypothetical protein
MEQLNNVLPAVQEDRCQTAKAASECKPMSPLLDKVRPKFGLYGGISLLFGGLFAALFFRARIGLNALLFTATMITLLLFIMKKLSLKIKTGTWFLYTGALLLGLASFLSTSEVLQFLNIIGILILLDVSLLHQLNDDHQWDFTKYIGRIFSLIGYSLFAIGMPFADSIKYMKTTKYLKNERLRNILIGLIVSIPVLLITTSLLSGADQLFGELTGRIFHHVFSADIFAFICMVIFGFLACYCILCGALMKSGLDTSKPFVRADASIAITFMSVLSLVYIVFCGIQILYLFANGLFTLPKEFTFAEYARKGYFELLAVTMINIVIILLCRSIFHENKWLRFLVIVMTSCTYVMIASAAYRMYLYITAYHFTFLRLFVVLTLFIDAFVLAGIMISEYHKKFPLFPYCVVVTLVCYLMFSFAKPDAFIASTLSEEKENLNLEDMRYMTEELSLDAAPYVLELLQDGNRWDLKTQVEPVYGYNEPESYEIYKTRYAEKIANAKENTGFRDFNISIYNAIRCAEKYH